MAWLLRWMLYRGGHFKNTDVVLVAMFPCILMPWFVDTSDVRFRYSWDTPSGTIPHGCPPL